MKLGHWFGSVVSCHSRLPAAMKPRRAAPVAEPAWARRQQRGPEALDRPAAAPGAAWRVGAGASGGGGMDGAGGAAGTGRRGRGRHGRRRWWPRLRHQAGRACNSTAARSTSWRANLGADLPGGNTNRTIELWAKFTGENSWIAEGSILETGKHVSAGNQVLGLDMSGRVDDARPFRAVHQWFQRQQRGSGAWCTRRLPTWVGCTSPGPSTRTPACRSRSTACRSRYRWAAPSWTPGLTPGIIRSAPRRTSVRGWYGVMDEVKIWSVSKTPAGMLAQTGVIPKADTAGLVAATASTRAAAPRWRTKAKKPSHKLGPCMAKSDICPDVNDAAPVWVDSDVPGTFSCAPELSTTARLECSTRRRHRRPLHRLPTGHRRLQARNPSVRRRALAQRGDRPRDCSRRGLPE